jgi:hypothetical protein
VTLTVWSVAGPRSTLDRDALLRLVAEQLTIDVDAVTDWIGR